MGPWRPQWVHPNFLDGQPPLPTYLSRVPLKFIPMTQKCDADSLCFIQNINRSDIKPSYTLRRIWPIRKVDFSYFKATIMPLLKVTFSSVPIHEQWEFFEKLRIIYKYGIPWGYSESRNVYKVIEFSFILRLRLRRK